MKAIRVINIILLFVVLLMENSTHAEEYAYTELLPSGWTRVYPEGINSKGDIVGWGYGADDIEKVFIYSNGNYTEFLIPGPPEMKAFSINEDSDVVGFVGDYRTYRGFIYNKGAYIEVVPPDFTWAALQAINNKGVAVGFGGPKGSTGSAGFLYEKGVNTKLLAPGWITSMALNINDGGKVVGQFSDSSGTRGFLYTGGKFTDLLPSDWDSSWSEAVDINNKGFVIGSGAKSGNNRGYLYDGKDYKEIAPPGWSCINLNAINDSGEIVGNGCDAKGVYGAFIYSGGTYRILELPDFFVEAFNQTLTATNINNAGIIIGYGLIAPGKIGGYIATPVPDLTGSWTTPVTQNCKTTTRGQKCTLKGTLTIENIGIRDASSTYVNFYLSDNGNFDQTDTPLKPFSTGKLKAGKSKSIKLNYNLPTGISASGKYVIGVIDPDNLVAEANESNNIVVYGLIP